MIPDQEENRLGRKREGIESRNVPKSMEGTSTDLIPGLMESSSGLYSNILKDSNRMGIMTMQTSCLQPGTPKEWGATDSTKDMETTGQSPSSPLTQSVQKRGVKKMNPSLAERRHHWGPW